MSPDCDPPPVPAPTADWTSAGETWTAIWLLLDGLRRRQGEALDAIGLGPSECRYDVLASGACWRLRKYEGGASGLPLLIVTAPIKRPYIWDFAPWASAVRRCLASGFRVYLLEWTAPRAESPGLADYIARFVGEAVAAVKRGVGKPRLFLMGHSLGGTLAAVFAAIAPESIRGIVLLASPLSFAEGSSRFRDGLVATVPSSFPATAVVPGSLISHLVGVADPGTFHAARLMDAGLSMSEPLAAAGHARVERWTLDEMALAGRLVHDLLELLYRGDRFSRGELTIGGTTVGPSSLNVPTLAVVNTDDQIAPPASVKPFTEAMRKGHARIIEHASEIGVGFPHLAILAGRHAHAQVWPRIISWLDAHV